MIKDIFTTKHLFSFTLALIAGICLAPYYLWSIFFLTISCAILYKEKNLQTLLICILCFFFFGSTRYHQHRATYFAESQLLNKNCNLVATVTDILPKLDEQEQICILLHVISVEIDGTSTNLNKNIYLFLPHYTTLWLKSHQKILLKNILLKHPRSESYQEYLMRENIWATAHQKKLVYTTLQKPSLLMQQLDELTNLPMKSARIALSELAHTLYLSIFCGKKIKSATTTEIKQLFQYWGISHQLARSGLHLIILIGILSLFLSFIPCSLTKKESVVVAVLFFYYLSTYPSVAFLRAFLMYSLYILCKKLNLLSSPIHILLIVALVILSINPAHIFFLDFQLSFSITLLILSFFSSTKNS